MVPKGWTETYLGEVITHKKGFAFNSDSYRDKGIRIVRISDTTRNSVHSENPVYLAEEDANGLENYKLTKDDIILSTVGSRPHLLDSMVGKAVKVPLEADGSLLNQNLVKVIPKASKITNEYLYEMLKNNRFIFFISTLVRGNANQVSITLSDLFQYQFVLPPLPEQKKIAQILSTWDKAITTTEQLLANSQQQKKALMQQLLTGKKRLLDKNGVRFSGEWKDVEFGKVLKEVKRPVDWNDDAEYKLLSVKRRSEGVVLREVLKGSAILTKKMNVAHSGDFLISKMQIVHGAAGLVSDEFDGFHVSDSYISLIPKDESKLNIHFFAWFAKQKLMYHKAFLCSYGVHIEKMTFNFKLFLKEKIRVPVSIEEQQKIAAVLSSADQEISALQQKLDALKQEKKALMQQLLTGKRRVKIDDKEVA